MSAPPPAPAPPPDPRAGQAPHEPSGASPADQPRSHAADEQQGQPPKRGVSVGQVLAGILLVIVVVFVLENTRKVKVRLLIPEVTAPLAVPIVVAAVLGALVAALMRWRRKRHRQQRAKQDQPKSRR